MPDIFAPIRVGTPWDTEPPAPRSDAIRGHMEIGRGGDMEIGGAHASNTIPPITED